jgi:uncharacterized protein (TIGR03067 family)
MRRFVSLLTVALLVVPSLGSDEPKEYDGAVHEAGLQGRWRRVAAEFGGRSNLDPGSWVYSFRGGTYAISCNGDVLQTGTYTADAGRLPAHLDFLSGPGNEETWKYIYRVEGDTLRIANMPGGQVRPHAFDQKGVVLTTYEREGSQSSRPVKK